MYFHKACEIEMRLFSPCFSGTIRNKDISQFTGTHGTIGDKGTKGQFVFEFCSFPFVLPYYA